MNAKKLGDEYEVTEEMIKECENGKGETKAEVSAASPPSSPLAEKGDDDDVENEQFHEQPSCNDKKYSRL